MPDDQNAPPTPPTAEDSPADPLDWRWWLRSRKVQIALAGLVVTLGSKYGLQLPNDVVAAIISMSCALILAIGIEDGGAKSAG